MPESEIQQQLDRAIRLFQTGQFAEAEALFRDILARSPDHPHALHLLGAVVHQSRRDPAAIELILRSIDLMPGNPDFRMNLGNVYRDQGKLGEALEAYQSAIRIRPDHAAAWNNMGNALRESGRLAEAVDAYQRALQLQPGLFETYTFLGNALRDLGQLEAAAAAHRQALTRNPRFVGAYLNLGAVLHDLQKPDEAIAAYQQALRVQPDAAEVLINLNHALRDVGRIDEAVAAGRRAVELLPNVPAAHNNLGTSLMHQGLIEQAVASFREALRLRPAFHETHRNLLFALHYRTRWDPETVLREHQAFDQIHAAPLWKEPTFTLHDRSPERRLRIGYVSPDFRDHPVGRFMRPIFEHRDRVNFELFLYSNGAPRDAVQDQLRGLCDHWHEVSALGDEPLDALIREHGIDILVDLAGHTSGTRILAFARKPAPVQVTYLGYPSTTGLRAIDYRITDALADPPGSEAHSTEKLVRLPGCFLCFHPPAGAPDVAPPVDSAGHITFASFNNFAKVAPESVEMWTRILQAVPHSRLLIKSRGLGDAATAVIVREAFAAAGADVSRIEIRSHERAFRDHLAAYNQVDIALDTFPYNGTTTTCEALWMGVPVVTLSGQTHASRVGRSLVTAAGFSEWIAQDRERYVDLAQELASDIQRLRDLRQTMRSRLLASPLCDTPLFTRRIESAFRSMWREWCAGPR
jgi:predicted O-linked N-acetylglucosamine transferase (SPINDLY family)